MGKECEHEKMYDAAISNYKKALELYPEAMEGIFFTLFSIGVSAAESAVAIAIIINAYRHFKSDSVTSIQNMKL